MKKSLIFITLTLLVLGSLNAQTMTYYDSETTFLKKSGISGNLAYTQVVTNPDIDNSINTNTSVSRVVRGAGDYANMKFSLDDHFLATDLENAIFKIKIYHESTGDTPLNTNNIGFALTQSGQGDTGRLMLTQNITASDEWVEYTFNFTGKTASLEYYNEISLFFILPTDDNADGQIYYFDAITGPFIAPSSIGMAYYDTDSAIFASTLIGTVEKDIPNPSYERICNSEKVLKVTRNANASHTIRFTLPEPITETNKSDAIFTVKIYFDKDTVTEAGNNLSAYLRLNNAGATQAGLNTTFTSENDWVEYTFNFSSLSWNSESYNEIILNLSRGSSTSKGAIYYIESLRGPSYSTSYTVSYDGNGNTSGVTPEDSTSLTGRTLTILENMDLEKTGYVFAGWSFTSDASTGTVVADDKFIVTQDTTLYAVWQENMATFQKDAHNKTTIYPNPTKGILNISASILSYSITSLSGKVIKENKLNKGTTHINISEFSDGIYLLDTYAADGCHTITKIVKQ